MPSKRPNSKVDPALSPVRIYVLWHPGYDLPGVVSSLEGDDAEKTTLTVPGRGLRLARRIYHWFRMENMEGIPVYFRSAPAPGGKVPPPVPDDPGVRNYLIALIDANMVACPDWRAYMADLAAVEEADTQPIPAKSGEYRLLPVALEPVSYNMPERIRRLNFVRHVAHKNKTDGDLELLSKLTEVLCRDLRHWSSIEASGQNKTVRTSDIPDKIRIFLSHAKADDTDEAVAIKEYIQRETQCEAFFDETDIASGYDFTNVLTAISKDSSGLIVLQGDNYADRPWCRKEIRDFLEPQLDPWGNANSEHLQYAIAPVVVVQTMKGRQIARTIPELGYSPCVRWQSNRPDAARFVVTTLLREICFGLFYRALAHRVALKEKKTSETAVYLNRSPDPVMINRIQAHQAKSQTTQTTSTSLTFVHPGYGLSKLEHEGLTSAFPNHHFRSFLGASTGDEVPMPDLRGKVIALSAGNPGDILSRGLWEEHMQELLIRLLQPMLRAQVSLLYGGAMPETFRPAAPWEKSLNFTGALLQLLLSERDSAGLRGTDAEIPRLYVPTPSHRRSTITPRLIAHWSDVCSFVHIPPEDGGLTSAELNAHPPTAPSPEQLKYLDDHEKAACEREHEQKLEEYKLAQSVLASRCLSTMRRKICDTAAPLTCELPDTPNSGQRTKRLNTLAHILIGGKLSGFTGIMPGIFEEALCAFDAKKPVFLVAGYGGAAALLARWLLNPPKERPPELTLGYSSGGGDNDGENMMPFQQPPNRPTVKLHHDQVEHSANRLWGQIRNYTSDGSLPSLLNNNLTLDENIALLQSTSSDEICALVSRGICSILEVPVSP